MGQTGERLAIDIGGTFTDVVFRAEDGSVRTGKVLTTPADITVGILEGADKVGARAERLEAFVHGTTIALNALLEGKTPPVGLITTAGFRDVLEIMRTNRPNMYDLQQQKPVPLVPRRHRREISARMTYTGETVRPVSEAEVEAIAREFGEAGIAGVAICLLHAYANPEHEQRVEEIVRAVLPDAEISRSSDVSRQWREFERTSTTVSNAATKPIVARYLSSLEQGLSTRGFEGRVLIMQSNGGVMTADHARQRPVRTLMSGPVGGVAGAAEIARRIPDARNLVTLDIGGTSADVAIIDGGDPVTRSVGHIAGWPIMVPMVDIESIGAGGGSIARVDDFGSLSVGPESAGADPGPACYGRGGTYATVTDANVVLGRINPSYFLGGDLSLDAEASRRVVEENVAGPYGMTTEQAALGIVTVVNSNMHRLLWEVMIGRGYDPRDFALLAFGGAGPLQACELAQALGIREVIVPAEPGTFSAYGISTADARHDYQRMLAGAEALDRAQLEAAFAELEREGREELEGEHAGYARIDLIRAAELRYFGQDHPLSVELGAERADDVLAECVELFHQKHERLYGFRRTDTPVELVRIEVSAIGRVAQLGDAPATAAAARPPGRRPVYTDRWVETPVHDRAGLAEGDHLDGPCVVEEPGCTTYVPPGFVLRFDRGLLRIAVPVPSPDQSEA